MTRQAGGQAGRQSRPKNKPEVDLAPLATPDSDLVRRQ